MNPQNTQVTIRLPPPPPHVPSPPPWVIPPTRPNTRRSSDRPANTSSLKDNWESTIGWNCNNDKWD